MASCCRLLKPNKRLQFEVDGRPAGLTEEEAAAGTPDYDDDEDDEVETVINPNNNNSGGGGGITTVETGNMITCEFSGSSDACVCVVTWNMSGRVRDEDLKEVVGKKKRKFDLLVIGLQEVPGKKNITQLLKNALSNTHVLLGKSMMQSLRLYIFGLKSSGPHVQELIEDKYAVGGCGGLISRKKGAVAVRVSYKGITMDFISCHLSAHAHNVEERNSQFNRISESLFSFKRLNKTRPPPHPLHPQLVVWLGDLNYRLQGVESYPARDLIHNNLQNLLTSKDQLHQEAERGVIFDGYNEGTLNFKPTYKYDIGSSNYDTSHKVRAPAWTDRILFKNEDPKRITATLRCYGSMDSIYSSDHKPVKAHLCLKINR